MTGERDIVLKEQFSVTGRDFGRAGTVSTTIKSKLKQIGFSPDVIRRVAIATYEAEINVVVYADRATVTFEVTPTEITVTLEDQGRGIADIEQAMQEGFSTATDEIREMGFGAGMGLPNIKKNSDDFEVTSEVGVGTTVRIKVLARQ
ncbi:MAG: ATP-binding protein [Candidatus Eisenbacteria sp.]|nr:ATP-binding protein [Candidatus Eisenbacteria bacterium]